MPGSGRRIWPGRLEAQENRLVCLGELPERQDPGNGAGSPVRRGRVTSRWGAVAVMGRLRSVAWQQQMG